MTFGDAGVYFCKVRYTRVSVGVIPSLRATLFIRGISKDPVNSYGVVGEKSTISCTIGGDKPEKVGIVTAVWLKISRFGTKSERVNEKSSNFDVRTVSSNN